MTLNELTTQPKMVRVISNTANPEISGMNDMIGGVFEVNTDYYCDKTKYVYSKDKSDYWNFKNSELQELTPIIHNGYQIGIGDKVNDGDLWGTVHGYYWCDGRYRVLVVEDNNFEDGCYQIFENHIAEVKPLYNPVKKIEHTDDELVAELERRGRLVDGKVLK
jgi:hypothetical protein